MTRKIKIQNRNTNTLREGLFPANIQSISEPYDFRGAEVCDVVFYIPSLKAQVERKVWLESGLFMHLVKACEIDPDLEEIYLDDIESSHVAVELATYRGFINVKAVMHIDKLEIDEEIDEEDIGIIGEGELEEVDLEEFETANYSGRRKRSFI